MIHEASNRTEPVRVDDELSCPMVNRLALHFISVLLAYLWFALAILFAAATAGILQLIVLGSYLAQILADYHAFLDDRRSQQLGPGSRRGEQGEGT
jgi:hypothetical protein